MTSLLFMIRFFILVKTYNSHASDDVTDDGDDGYMMR